MAYMNSNLTLLSLAVLLLSCFPFQAAFGFPVTYSVVTLGAKPDGRTDSTKAFLAAWSRACNSNQPASIYVPAGRFFLRSVAFRGPCKNNAISIGLDGSTLVAPSNYAVIGNAGNWILFENVAGVSIHGGFLDGQGTGLWNCKASGKGGCPTGATSLEFSNSHDIGINGVTSINSQLFHIVVNGCSNVKIQGVRVTAPGNSPNTDGIHVQSSSGVTILNSNIGTGDDCISIGPGARNLWMEGIACGPGHGISIGSLGKSLQEPGVENVTVRSVRFSGTQNGLRIKSWGRPSNGFARNILFEDATMSNVQNPIIIDQNYCPGDKDCPGQNSGVRISEVTYQDIHGTSATPVGVKFDCSPEYPCSGIRLENVKVTYMNEPAAAACSHAGGTASGFVQLRPESCL